MAKIMLVDDSSFMRERCKKILEKEGHQVVQAEDGALAVEKYKKENPQLVFMDITMPNLNGIEAVEKIIEFDKNAKIIMLSAMGQKTTVMEAIKKGAKYFLVKPFSPEKVLEACNKYL